MMPREPRKELGAAQVAALWRRGTNHVGGVRGLILNVTMYGSRSWVLRYQVAGKRRDLGLGSYPSVTLADAREAARAARAKLAQGIDPIEDARRARARLVAEIHTSMTFGEAAKRYIASHEKGWKNAKHAQQWQRSLDMYATPVLGKMPVRDISLAMVLKALEPIWSSKTETATRLRGRIESVIDWAIARGYRTDSNPARWKGLLDKLLPAPGKVTKTTHFQALPYAQLPVFMEQLVGQDGMGAKALLFLILTAARSGEVRGATWEEIDLAARVWTIPAERMKARRPHSIYLTDQALEIFTGMQPQTGKYKYVFTGRDSKQKPLAIATFRQLLYKNGWAGTYSPHGTRTTGSTMLHEMGHRSELIDAQLAHIDQNQVRRTYNHTDYFSERAKMMKEWCDIIDEISKDGVDYVS